MFLDKWNISAVRHNHFRLHCVCASCANDRKEDLIHPSQSLPYSCTDHVLCSHNNALVLSLHLLVITFYLSLHLQNKRIIFDPCCKVIERSMTQPETPVPILGQDDVVPSYGFAQPMVSTKQIPLGTRLFFVAILLVVLAITTYLFFFRTDNVAVGYAKNYPPSMFSQQPSE